MIIGITGPIASGKGVLTEMLVENGFIRMSLSQEVREEAKKLGLPIERTTLQNIGNEMRKKFGNGYWAKRLVDKVDEEKNYVIEGIRNPGEVEELRKNRNFILVGVTAPVEKRWEWIKMRDKDSDPKNIEAIKAIDSRDRGYGEGESGQQTEKCFEIADYYIFNNSDLIDLKERVKQLVKEFGIEAKD